VDDRWGRIEGTGAINLNQESAQPRREGFERRSAKLLKWVFDCGGAIGRRDACQYRSFEERGVVTVRRKAIDGRNNRISSRHYIQFACFEIGLRYLSAATFYGREGEGAIVEAAEFLAESVNKNSDAAVRTSFYSLEECRGHHLG